MGRERASLSTFSSRGRQIRTARYQEDIDLFFDASDQKRREARNALFEANFDDGFNSGKLHFGSFDSRQVKDVFAFEDDLADSKEDYEQKTEDDYEEKPEDEFDDLDIMNTFSGDVFDGLELSPTSESEESLPQQEDDFSEDKQGNSVDDMDDWRGRPTSSLPHSPYEPHRRRIVPSTIKQNARSGLHSKWSHPTSVRHGSQHGQHCKTSLTPEIDFGRRGRRSVPPSRSYDLYGPSTSMDETTRTETTLGETTRDETSDTSPDEATWDETLRDRSTFDETTRDDFFSEEDASSVVESVTQESTTGEGSTALKSRSRDMSTVHTQETSVVLPDATNDFNPLAVLTCPEGSGGLQKLLALSIQCGVKLEEMNQFLYEELEVKPFTEDLKELKQEVVKHGKETLVQVDWVALFKSLYRKPGGSPDEEPPSLTSAASPDGQALLASPDEEQPSLSLAASPSEEPPGLTFEAAEEDRQMELPSSPSFVENDQTELHSAGSLPQPTTLTQSTSLPNAKPDPPALRNPFAGCLHKVVDDMVFEEGMEMSYSVCGDSTSMESKSHSSEKKKQPFLAKLFPGQKKSASAPKKRVMRVKLQDGSMASVSEDTASRLQRCHWV